MREPSVFEMLGKRIQRLHSREHLIYIKLWTANIYVKFHTWVEMNLMLLLCVFFSSSVVVHNFRYSQFLRRREKEQGECIYNGLQNRSISFRYIEQCNFYYRNYVQCKSCDDKLLSMKKKMTMIFCRLRKKKNEILEIVSFYV